MAALLLLLSIFYAATFVRPLSAAALNAVRYILRLDGRGARRVSLRCAECCAMRICTVASTATLFHELLGRDVRVAFCQGQRCGPAQCIAQTQLLWQGRASVPATAGVGSEGSGVLGSNERSIISKYGADNDAEDAGEDDEGEDGEDAAP